MMACSNCEADISHYDFFVPCTNACNGLDCDGRLIVTNPRRADDGEIIEDPHPYLTPMCWSCFVRILNYRYRVAFEKVAEVRGRTTQLAAGRTTFCRTRGEKDQCDPFVGRFFINHKGPQAGFVAARIGEGIYFCQWFSDGVFSTTARGNPDLMDGGKLLTAERLSTPCYEFYSKDFATFRKQFHEVCEAERERMEMRAETCIEEFLQNGARSRQEVIIQTVQRAGFGGPYDGQGRRAFAAPRHSCEPPSQRCLGFGVGNRGEGCKCVTIKQDWQRIFSNKRNRLANGWATDS